MEVPEDPDNSVTETDVKKNSIKTTSGSIEPVKSQRKAATQAKLAIQKHLNNNVCTILFCFPREC